MSRRFKLPSTPVLIFIARATVNWEIPSGVVKKHETYRQAAARELKEETGYRPHTLTPLLTFHPTMAIIQTIHLFTAENIVKETANAPDEEEFILEVKSFTLPESRARDSIIWIVSF